MDAERVIEIAQGLTRPVVTALLAITLCVGFLFGKVDSQGFQVIVVAAVTWWFSDRQADKDVTTTKAADKLVEKMTAPKVEP